MSGAVGFTQSAPNHTEFSRPMLNHRVLLYTGGEHHPWDQFERRAAEWLAGGFRLEVVHDTAAFAGDRLAEVDALMLYSQGGDLRPGEERALVEWVAAGGALAAVHSAMASFKGNARYHEMLGGTFAGHGPVAEFAVTLEAPGSPITAGLTDFAITDELYLVGGFDPAGTEVLATAESDGATQPLVYARRWGEGRVYFLGLGHDDRAFDHPAFRPLLLRGLRWALGAL
jgi:hypothetical protein